MNNGCMISQPVLPGHLIPLGPVQGFPDGETKEQRKSRRSAPRVPDGLIDQGANQVDRARETTRTEEQIHALGLVAQPPSMLTRLASAMRVLVFCCGVWVAAVGGEADRLKRVEACSQH
jgi:hypothetical protein